MKHRLFFFVTLFFSVSVFAQVHIQIDNPETWAAEELKPYIGKTVIFDSPLVVCSNAQYPTFTVSPRRLFTPTNQAYPRTQAYRSVVSLNSTGAIDMNGVGAYHRCGEKIYNLKAKVNSTSSLTYIDGEFRGNSRADLEAGIPDLGDYRLLVCTMNLEYYLAAGLGSGGMGPASASQHEAQRMKVSKALALINADIYGFVEIESGQVALKEIATDLNAHVSGRKFTYINDGSSPNGTYTKAGFVYDANKVKPIGKLQETDIGVQNRKKMICFEEIATHERFIFSVNHFKAKSGSGSGGDANQNDGQGSFNETRMKEAQEVISMYNGYYSHRLIHDKDLLVMGDLNAYAKEDPIALFTKNGMIDLHRAFHADSSYSYQFAGLAGYLDHAICNKTLYPQVTGMAGFHINSDENDNYTYNGKWSDNTMFRCSDHDPVLVGLKLDSTLSQSLDPYVYVENFSDNVTFNNLYNLNDPQNKSYFAIYNIDGVPICPPKEIKYTEEMLHQKNKVYEVSLDNPYLPEELREFMPLPSGVYILHVYTKGEVLYMKFVVK